MTGASIVLFLAELVASLAALLVFTRLLSTGTALAVAIPVHVPVIALGILAVLLATGRWWR